MFRRICAHSGSSFGSNTTHCVPRNRLSSRNRPGGAPGRTCTRRPASAAAQGARAPDDAAVDREAAQHVQAQGVDDAVFTVGQVLSHFHHPVHGGVGAGRRFPEAARRIGTRIDACHRPRRGHAAQAQAVQGIGNAHGWEVRRTVARLRVGGRPCGRRCRKVCIVVQGRQVGQIESPARLAKTGGGAHHADRVGLRHIEGLGNRQQVEQVHVQQGVDAGLGRFVADQFDGACPGAIDTVRRRRHVGDGQWLVLGIAVELGAAVGQP
jgi:hypothetical protein